MNNERIAKNCVCCSSTKLVSSPAVLMPFVADRAFGWKPIKIEENWGLKTIDNGYAYSICNTLYCSNCNFIFLDIRFSEQELNNIYKHYREEDYVNLREFYEPGYKLRNEKLVIGLQHIGEIESFLDPFLKFPISVLDWGGDTGNNTPYKKKNIKFDIYDISNRSVVKGAKFIDKRTILKNAYDLIVCSHVLEHIPYPSDILREIRKIMHQKTILYIEVPFESIMQNNSSYLIKKHWHEHINFFSEKALSKLIESIGLKILKFKKLNIIVEGENSYVLQVACNPIE